MDHAKVRVLLEKLRARTESRGATAAEAVQAADLAEKIAVSRQVQLLPSQIDTKNQGR